jgi:hypothetical protein
VVTFHHELTDVAISQLALFDNAMKDSIVLSKEKVFHREQKVIAAGKYVMHFMTSGGHGITRTPYQQPTRGVRGLMVVLSTQRFLPIFHKQH